MKILNLLNTIETRISKICPDNYNEEGLDIMLDIPLVYGTILDRAARPRSTSNPKAVLISFDSTTVTNLIIASAEKIHFALYQVYKSSEKQLYSLDDTLLGMMKDLDNLETGILFSILLHRNTTIVTLFKSLVSTMKLIMKWLNLKLSKSKKHWITLDKVKEILGSTGAKTKALQFLNFRYLKVMNCFLDWVISLQPSPSSAHDIHHFSQLFSNIFPVRQLTFFQLTSLE